MLKKIFRVSAFIVIVALVGLMFPLQEINAAAFTEVRDYLGRMTANLTSGETHEIYIKPATAVSGGSGNNKVILVFPDADDQKWCATAGTDGTAVTTGLIESGFTALPGTSLSVTCVAGSGTTSYDTVTISGVDNLTAGTLYGVKISGGTTEKLGTPPTSTDGIITVKTNDGTSDVDSSDIAVDILSNDQVSVSASVGPTLTFSISDNSIGFGSLTSASVYYATGDESGSTTEPGSDLPVDLTLSTNAANGAIITIKDANGGLTTTAGGGHTISAVGPNSVSAGSEGYAVYGKDASGLSIASGFTSTGTTAISTSYQTFATATGPVSNVDVDLAAKASVSGTTQTGSYTDTITVIATGKF